MHLLPITHPEYVKDPPASASSKIPNNIKSALIILTDIPPSINHYYFTAKNGRKFLSKEGVSFRELASMSHVTCWDFNDGKSTAGLSTSAQAIGPPSFYHIDIAFINPYKGRWDVDNRVKPLFDAIQKTGFIVDDTCISSHTASKFHGEGRATVIWIHKISHARQVLMGTGVYGPLFFRRVEEIVQCENGLPLTSVLHMAGSTSEQRL